MRSAAISLLPALALSNCLLAACGSEESSEGGQDWCDVAARDIELPETVAAGQEFTARFPAAIKDSSAALNLVDPASCTEEFVTYSNGRTVVADPIVGRESLSALNTFSTLPGLVPANAEPGPWLACLPTRELCGEFSVD